MNERTAEEKLRQALMGDTSDKDTGKKNLKTPQKITRRIKKTADTARSTDSFMEDFEKKIEQSLNSEHILKNAPSSSEKHPKKISKAPIKLKEKHTEQEQIKISQPAQEEKVIRELVIFDGQKPASIPVQIEETLPIQEPLKAAETAQEVQTEPEIFNEPVEVEDSIPEIEQKEPEIIDTPVEVEEKISEPLIDEKLENTEAEEENLPEIPLIEEKEDNSEDLQDFENFDNESGNEDEIFHSDEDTLPDIPLISAEPESETFSHPADIVLNVDEEIPRIQEPETNPEGESVPVSVVMPETTKTAEDKLMADIAEAMTGSPLTLETKETPEPYKLPENFLNEVNDDPSKRSAEEKLIANIAQAMTESPLDAATNNVQQDLERDLNNFENFMPSAFPENEEPLTEEFDFSHYEEEDKSQDITQDSENEQEEEPAKPETEIEATFDESPLPDPVPEPDPEPAEEKENLEIAEEHEQEPFNTDVPLLTEEEQEEPAENNIGEYPEINEIQEAFNAADEENHESEENFTLIENEKEDKNEEVHQEDNMPEQSLLDDDNENESAEIAPESDFEDEEDEDFDINSLGALSAATSMPDYEEPEPEPEQEYNDYEKTPTATLINQGEEEEKAKVMGIREKIAGRKEQMGKENSGNKKKLSLPSFSGFNLSTLLLVFLLAVGGFISWQLMQLNDKLTSGFMSMGMPGEFASMPVENSNPSYEYAIDFIFDTNLSSRMTQRGKDGWQVVGSRRTQDSITGQLGYEFIFMRKAKGK